MALSHPVLKQLQEAQVPYEYVSLVEGANLVESIKLAGVNPRQIIKAELYEDATGPLLIVMPLHGKVNLDLLNHQMGRQLHSAETDRIGQLFPECSHLPPFGSFFNVRTLIDRQIIKQREVFFGLGLGRSLFRVATRDFAQVQTDALWGNLMLDIPVPERKEVKPQQSVAASTRGNTLVIPEDIQHLFEGNKFKSTEDVLHRLERVEDFPILPEMARQLLQLRNNSKGSVTDLTRIVELDPSLTAQVMRYARSAFFGYKGKLESIHDAIARVLGYDSVLNMSLGLAAGRSFNMPKEGPLGMRSLWRHAIYSATLAQVYSTLTEGEDKAKSGIAYLGGLLHDFGYFMLGHLYQDEYRAITRLMQANPHIPLEKLERHVLGTTHGEIGARLLEAWNMPEEIVACAREHHNAAYEGDHKTYVQLMHLADDVIDELGDVSVEDDSDLAAPQTDLAISADRISMVAKRVQTSRDQLDDMVRRMAA